MKTHQGSCHCGVVRFEADLDLHTASRCNCRLCTKLALFGAKTQPEQLRVLAGEDSLGTWTTQIGKLYFCKTCGAHPFSRGDLPGYGGPYAAVNVNCLDDVDPTEITAAYWDGRHDNWQAGTSSKPWPYEPTQAAQKVAM
jgi:hypothetical protein